MAVPGKAAERGPGNFAKRAVDEAKKDGLSMDYQLNNIDEAHGPGASKADPEPAKPSLFKDGQMPENPVTVRGKRMMMQYVRPHYCLDKDDRTIELEFSLSLEKEHRGLLPEIVEEEWKHLAKGNSGSIGAIDIPAQTIDLFLAATDKTEEIHLRGALITKASLQIIEETGAGAAVNVTRLKFRVIVDVADKAIREFADLQYGHEVWMTMETTQRKLGEK